MRRMRKARDLSLEQMAERCGPPTTAGQVSDVERGKVGNPGIELFLRLCRGLEITPDQLLIEAGELAPPPGYLSPAPPAPELYRAKTLLEQALAAVTAVLPSPDDEPPDPKRRGQQEKQSPRRRRDLLPDEGEQPGGQEEVG